MYLDSQPDSFLRYHLQYGVDVDLGEIGYYSTAPYTDKDILDLLEAIIDKECGYDDPVTSANWQPGKERDEWATVKNARAFLDDGTRNPNWSPPIPKRYGKILWPMSWDSAKREDYFKSGQFFSTKLHQWDEENGDLVLWLPMEDARQDDLLYNLSVGQQGDMLLESMLEDDEGRKEAIELFRSGELFAFLCKRTSDVHERVQEERKRLYERRGITEELKATEPDRYVKEADWVRQQVREMLNDGLFN